MYLMCENEPIMKIDIDKGIYEVINEKKMPYALKSYFYDKTPYQCYDKIMDYLARRVLNIERENAKKLLNAYHISQSQSVTNKVKIAMACKAVSMTDSYWLKTENSNDTWNDLNPRHCSLNQIVSHIALTGSSLTLTGFPHTPELTGQGAYAKAWMRENNDIYLYKSSTKHGIESQTEVSVSNILDCFNVPHVQYEKAIYQDYATYVCKCKAMSSDFLSILTAEEYYEYCNRMDYNFMNNVLQLDSENIYKMCIMDFLYSNADRHGQNWGFYVNNQTGNILCCHPLFDHNNAFDENDMKAEDGGESLIFSNHSKKEVALYSIKRCTLLTNGQLTKDIFLSDECYESFMQRASLLGLYQKEKPNFFQKIHLSKFDEYQPIQIGTIQNINYEQLRISDNKTSQLQNHTDTLKSTNHTSHNTAQIIHNTKDFINQAIYCEEQCVKQQEENDDLEL